MHEKKIFTLRVCSGVGIKTTYFSILDDIPFFEEFINADELARGYSPFQTIENYVIKRMGKNELKYLFNKYFNMVDSKLIFKHSKIE